MHQAFSQEVTSINLKEYGVQPKKFFFLNKVLNDLDFDSLANLLNVHLRE